MFSVRLRFPLRLSLAFSLLLSIVSSTAFSLPADFVEEDLFQERAKMIALEFLPDGRMLAMRKTGEMHIFDPQQTPPLPRVDYMVITDLNSDDERGLLDIAIDPNFSNNNYFYLYYVNGSTNRARVSRFQHEENAGGTTSRGDLNSEQVIWEDNVDATGCCHYGGSIVFGPDGKLYFIIGDKFDNPVSQDLTQSGGKIYRLNKDGTFPTDNPDFSAIEPNALPGIWAFGIRNPFRSSWDAQRSRLLMGEVGGNDQATATEDLHVGKAGANYGWPNCEGSTCNPSSPPFPVPFEQYDAPLFSYDHAGVGAAIIGGFVYEGSIFPGSYQDAYFYGDYARGTIRHLTFNGQGDVTADSAFHDGADKITSLKEGPDGALYYTRFSNGAKIRRIRYLGSGGNQPPVITEASADPVSGADPLDVDFTGSATDSENDPLTYHWIFGDGNEVDGASVSHTYNGNGSYSAVLQVSDGTTTVASNPVQIDVGSPPIVTLLTPEDGSFFRAGETIEFSASATDPDETLGESNYNWEVLFHHNDHFHTGPTFVGSSGNMYVETTGHDWNDSTRYEFIVDVHDSDGLTDTASVFVFPDKVDFTLETDPPGQTIYLDGIPKITPIVYDTLIDFQHTVEAPGTACINDTEYTFDSWSDGGAATHDIIVPDTDLSLLATYVLEGSACSVGPPVTPTITITSPVEGQTVVGTDVTVQYDIQGTGYDHVHFSIDSDPYIAEHNLTGTFVFSNVAEGAHTIRAALVNANHSELTNPEAVTTVNVNVSQAGGDPGIVTLVSPSGTISERTPAYTWNADPNATRYKLRVNDSTGTKKVDDWYTATEAGCESGTGTCSATPSYQLADGDGWWKVRAANDSVKASYSDSMDFTVDLSAGGGNQAPVANDDSATVTEGVQATIDVVGNDTDADGSIDPATVLIVGNPSHGTIDAVNADGAVDYTASAGYTGADSFTYTVEDNLGAVSNLGTVDITVEAVGNQSPVANDDSATVTEGVQATIDVVGNDTDADGSIDPSTVQIVGNPSHGTLDAVNVDGTVDYTADAGYHGADSFTYTVEDDLGAVSNVATVNVTVEAAAGGGDPGIVTLVSPNGTITERSPTYIWNADPFAIRYKLRVNDSTGTRKVNDWYTAEEVGCDSGTGTCSATPSYQLADGDGWWKVRAANDSVKASYSDPMLFTVDTAGGNQSPVANDDSATVTQGVQAAIDVVGNDTDADGSVDTSTVQIVGNPSHGTIDAVNADGTVDYTADAGYDGADSFTYTVEDNLGVPSNVATVDITVDPATSGGDPGIVTLVSPSGTITERSPTYTWNADPYATKYRLRVNDSTGTKRVNDWYTAAEAGCASGTGTCSATPVYELADGDGWWKVKAATETVLAPFSESMLFTVSGAP